MKTLHVLLTRQVLATVLMTVAVFTFVLLLGNVLKEILSLLVNRQADLPRVLQAIGLLIPFVLAFALPMGLLTATLLVFGRFSADNELTAARASGVSLLALITPVLILSVAMSCVCAIVNLQLAPRCRVAYKHLLFSLGVEKLTALLPERTVLRNFPGFIVCFREMDGEHFKHILIYELDKEGKVQGSLQAARGRLTRDAARRKLRLQLFEVWKVWADPDGEHRPGYSEEYEFELDLVAPTEREPSISDLTFWQLQKRMRQLERQLSWAPRRGTLSPEALREEKRRLEEQKDDLLEPFRVHLHRQASFSFACIGFTLVGIPLGIRAHRRETSAGVAMALVLVLLYYSFIILAQSLDNRAEYYPHLIVWLPNFLFQAVGVVLLWRANRGL